MHHHNKEVWNKKAEKFGKMKIVSKDNEYIQNMLRFYKGDLKQAKVLDIGCGTGIWSLCLAKDVKRIVGVDISDVMIGYAEKNKAEIGADNAEFLVADWTEMEPGKGVLAERYDIVIMHMTPAVRTIEDVQKAMDVCDGCCFYTSGFSHTSNLNSLLDAKANKPRCGGHREIFFDLMKYLVDNGIRPYIAYDTSTFDESFDVDACIADNKTMYPELTEDEIGDIVRSIAVGDKVDCHSEMIHITTYWSMD